MTDFNNIINAQRGIQKIKTQNSGITADNFNEYFASIASNLVSEIPVSDANPVDNLNHIQRPPTSFDFAEVTFNEIRDIINNLKNKTSRDIFGINVNLIKSVKNVIIAPLTKLINLCFKENVFPSILKIAIITPIYKKGDKNMPSNYRPISLLPIISKIVEKCIVNRIVNFLEKYNLFSKDQFGFRKGKNTVQAISNLVSDITNAFTNLEYDAVLFCDLSKAFDCVDHGVLLRKLAPYGFSPDSVELLRSYLEDRCQIVRVDGKESGRSYVNIGIPQGSILGPVLFLVYINDLPMIDNSAHYTIFSDDTTVAFRSKTFEGALEGSMAAQMRACDWFRTNKLLLNEDKTKRIFFSMRNLHKDNNLDDINFLGVCLDPRLQWGGHVDRVGKRLASSLFLLRNLADNVSSEILKLAYFALFHTHFSYAIEVWGHSADTYRIFRLQRKAVRLLAGLRFREDCREAFKSLGILTLPSLFIYRNLLNVKSNNELYQTHDDLHDYNTRNKSKIVPIHYRLKRCQSGQGYWSIKFYNKLPDKVKNLPFKNFKNKVRVFLIKNAYYSFNEYLSSDHVNEADF